MFDTVEGATLRAAGSGGAALRNARERQRRSGAVAATSTPTNTINFEAQVVGSSGDVIEAMVVSAQRRAKAPQPRWNASYRLLPTGTDNLRGVIGDFYNGQFSSNSQS